MRKRIFVAVLALVMVGSIALAGCGNSGTSDSSNTDNTADSNTEDSGTSEASGEGLKIGLTVSLKDEFLTKLEDGVKETATANNAELTSFDAQNDVQKQIDQINTFVTQGFDAIIVQLVDSESTESLVTAAKDTPLIFVNREPLQDFLVAGKSAFVGSDENVAGGFQGEFLSEYFKDKSPKELNYILFMGPLGNQSVSKRSDSVKKALEDAGFKLNKAYEDTAEWDRAKAMEKMQAFIGTGKPFDVVIANNDEMALGAIEALRAVNKLDIPVVGIDATDAGLTSVEAGELAATVFQDAFAQGVGSVETAVGLINGSIQETNIMVPYKLVTKDNYKEFQ